MGVARGRIDASPDPQVIRAAGGLLWWRGPRGPRVAVIHRPKYDDWALPKGKLEPGETWRRAAIREVKEETGCRIRVVGFAGVVSYIVRGRPKVVMFWNMERVGERAFQPNREIDRLEWLTPRQALSRLNHPAERDLLRVQCAVEATRH